MIINTAIETVEWSDEVVEAVFGTEKRRNKMIEITCLNEKNETFTKTFNSPYNAKKFINKCKRSKKVLIVSILNC